jgi:hypothetical protein
VGFPGVVELRVHRAPEVTRQAIVMSRWFLSCVCVATCPGDWVTDRSADLHVWQNRQK